MKIEFAFLVGIFALAIANPVKGDKAEKIIKMCAALKDHKHDACAKTDEEKECLKMGREMCDRGPPSPEEIKEMKEKMKAKDPEMMKKLQAMKNCKRLKEDMKRCMG